VLAVAGVVTIPSPEGPTSAATPLGDEESGRLRAVAFAS